MMDECLSPFIAPPLHICVCTCATQSRNKTLRSLFTLCQQDNYQRNIFRPGVTAWQTSDCPFWLLQKSSWCNSRTRENRCERYQEETRGAWSVIVSPSSEENERFACFLWVTNHRLYNLHLPSLTSLPFLLKSFRLRRLSPSSPPLSFSPDYNALFQEYAFVKNLKPQRDCP